MNLHATAAHILSEPEYGARIPGRFQAILSRCALLLFLAMIPGLASDRTDIIILKNGDRLTGSIRKVGQGILELKCDHGNGRYRIYWDQVERIESKKVVSVELSSGTRVRGSLSHEPNSPEEHIVQGTGGEEVRFRLPEVAMMHEGERGFWGHFDGNFGAGYTLAKANDTQQFSLNGGVNYYADKFVANGSLDALFSSQKGASNTERYHGAAYLYRVLKGNWFVYGGADFLHSDELQLDLRSVALGGAGRFLRRDSKHSIGISGGAGWNREVYFNPVIGNQNTPEALFAGRWNVYNLLDDNLNMINGLAVYKSLSQGSRTRFDLDSELRWGLPKHLYFNVKFANNYDSSPLGKTPKNDFVFSTGFGYAP